MTDYVRYLSYNDLLLSSTGNIIGAGIFTLLGTTHKYSGDHTWLSTLIAGLFIYGTVYPYSKINGKYGSNLAEAEVIKNAYGNKMSISILFGVIIAGILTVYLVSKSFGNYFSEMSGLDNDFSVLMGIGLACLLNISGISHVAVVNNIVTLIGVGILLLLVIIGFGNMIMNNNFRHLKSSFEFSKIKDNIWNVLKGAYIIIFSYFGFELLIKLNKESINPDDIPKAMKSSVLFTTILYTLLALVYSYSMNISKSTEKYEEEKTPLATSAKIITGNLHVGKIVTVAGVCLTFNTVLLILAGVARLMDGNSIGINTKKETVPKKYILGASAAAITLFLSRINIESTAITSNTLKIIMFVSVYLSVNKLKL